VATGTALGQGIVILASPVLARLYSPHDFGVLAVVTSLSALCGVLVTLRLDMAIPLAESDDEASGVAWASLLSCAALSLPLAFGGFALYDLAAPSTDAFSMSSVMLTAVASALIGATAVAIRWLGRSRDYRRMARLSAAQGWLQVLAQLAFSTLSLGLLAGLAAGRLPALTILHSAKSGQRPAWLGWRNAGAALSRFRRFALISSWGGFLNTAGLQSTPLVVAAVAGSKVAGTYLLAQRFLAAPTVLLAQAISEVNYSELGHLHRTGQGEIYKVVKKTLQRTAIIAVPCFTAAALVSPIVVPIVLGSQWHHAGAYVAALTPGMAAQFIVIPVSRTLLLLERQGLQSTWELARLVLVTGSVIGVFKVGGGPVEALLALSLAQVVTYAALAALTLRSSWLHDAA